MYWRTSIFWWKEIDQLQIKEAYFNKVRFKQYAYLYQAKYLTIIGFRSFWVNFRIKAYLVKLLFLELNSFVKIKIISCNVCHVELFLSIKSTFLENEFDILSPYLTPWTFTLLTVKRRYSSMLKRCRYVVIIYTHT